MKTKFFRTCTLHNIASTRPLSSCTGGGTGGGAQTKKEDEGEKETMEKN